ncbi:Na+/H+ antiporter [Rhodospirillum rubrum]|uniref:Na+/H+ antiporter n=1 Tax=Rhodospirillum rubrum TaxID=1085 RepID=UPI00190555A2|nr:Na+/H+ antiporter [Rhodospirillum rubrum]MBK1665403.1 Na+/H+ antiporter [Rhodospirillum rubrum]MBK1677335.1 Na+/H+ antiporter [Rhodospirillum rubrum]
METITVVLFLLFCVVVSDLLARTLPIPVPRPLYQIALGGVIGLFADLRVVLDPDIFFLLFLPPLLFLDGWHIAREEVFKDRFVILELAFGLVVLTVLGAGLFINWMIPAMPLAVAFALAAVVSPTDPIAVSAIAKHAPIPKRMMNILEGESLLNDASGLVCLRFAVAAALTGSFSLTDAALDFLWVALAGIAVGISLTWAVTRSKNMLARRIGESSATQTLVSLLIPFGSYLVAEHLDCSGILAAVAAGVTMSIEESSGQAQAATRIRRNTVWDTIQFAANGVIFVILGEQLPAILEGAAETVRMTGHHEPWWLGIYVVAICLGLAALRFLWVWASLQVSLLRTGQKRPPRHWRLISAMSLSGVRGAITLAGVLTLPLTMTDGSAFPARDLAIFLAMGVIIVTMVVATVFLPLLLNGLEMPRDSTADDQEAAARIAAAEAAIAEIERVQHSMAAGAKDADLFVTVGASLMDVYRERVRSRSQEGEAAVLVRRIDWIEREMRLAALRAERGEIFRRVRKYQLGSERARKLIRELDLLETRYSAEPKG